MANTKISNLTASAANLASTDLAPIVQTAGVGPVKMTGAQIAAGLLSATTPIGSGPILSRAAAASLQLGAADAAAPVAQTLQVQSVVAGTTDTAGAAFTINGSKGTGTGLGGSLIFQVAPSGTTGTSQNSLVSALTITPSTASRLVVSVGTSTSFINFQGLSTPSLNVGSGASAYQASGHSGDQFNLWSSNNNVASVNSGGIRVAANLAFSWSNSNTSVGTGDTFLYRDAANTLALRNGTTAQSYRIYNTYTDASNNEYLTLDWSTTANTATIATVANGSGTIRALALKSATGTVGFSASSISLDTSRQIRWATSPITYIVPRTANDINFGLDAASPLACTIGGCGARSSVDTDTAGANFIVRGGLGTGTGNGGNLQFAVGLPGSTGNATNATVNIAYFAGASGHLLWNTDNTYDIGASGANRPRYVRAGSAIVTPSTTVASLPSASTAGAGARSFVTDANATTFLSTVAGGGANKVPVVSDGTNWLIG